VKKLLLGVAMLAVLNTQSKAGSDYVGFLPPPSTVWWTGYRPPDQKSYVTCESAAESPASFYEYWRNIGYSPTLEDKGEMVTITHLETGPTVGTSYTKVIMTFFRSKEACEKEVQTKLVAPELTKYR
jgi:hypothetical protein